MKWCGKSAPRSPSGEWQAKPRTEQVQIGRRLRVVRPKSPGRSHDPASNDGARGMVVIRRGCEKLQPVGDRIRLINRLWRNFNQKEESDGLC